ncbi:hypothetical protein [Polaribacter cellanae]|uniref:Uncharacterized protein n=1 Tax=Polaribacter cellanae TaxID=2818493 RepID=A0A975H885_9FLAO|nr:hypothetical protein [Polaribacter cellanae]QTE24301.1 hypothetical protein J3359_08590 [Polaribacter cellanae]
MALFKKIYWLIFPLTLFICLLILDKVFNVDNFFIRTFISGAIAFILSPRKRIIQTQTGKIKQITWIFLKKSVIIE